MEHTVTEALKVFKPIDSGVVDPIEDRNPYRDVGCTLGKPLWIVIQPGEPFTLDCPVHGSHTVYGGGCVW